MADFSAIQELIHVKFSGKPNDSFFTLNFIINSFVVVIFGVCMWYINQRIAKRRANKKCRSTYFQTEYSKQWRKR